MTDRCRQFRRVLATYRGLGVKDRQLAEAVSGLASDPTVTPNELEIALHQYVPAVEFENENRSSRELALAGGLNERSAGPRQGQRF